MFTISKLDQIHNLLRKKSNRYLRGLGNWITARLGLFSGLREQELIDIKEKAICNDRYGCNYEKLHVVNNKNNDYYSNFMTRS